MAISKDALASLLKSQALAADEPMPEAEPVPADTDAPGSDEVSDADLAVKLKELIGCETNAECLAAVSAMLEAAASAECDTEEKKAEEAVAEAVRTGRLTPAQRSAALKVAKFDLDAFRAIAKGAAPRVAAPRAAAPASAHVVELTKEELARCAALKIKPETMLSAKKNLIEKGSK